MDNTNIVKGYYKPSVLEKFENALNDAYAEVAANPSMAPIISNRNSKMGEIASVSLLPFLTCPARCSESCGPFCYAAKIANLRPNVLRSYAINTILARDLPYRYWNAVSEAVKMVRYFRFHVSGDILNQNYLDYMVKCAKDNPHCDMLVFTKRYELINKYIRDVGEIPMNLHILFSGWTNLVPDNPYHFPETNVIPHGELPKPEWKMCGGNCFNCACRGVGCWQAKSGDTIAFPQH